MEGRCAPAGLTRRASGGELAPRQWLWTVGRVSYPLPDGRGSVELLAIGAATVREWINAQDFLRKNPSAVTNCHSRLSHYLLLLRIAHSWSGGHNGPPP